MQLIGQRAEQLRLAEPLPQALLAAAAVTADFGLAENWLNAGPADELDTLITARYVKIDDDEGLARLPNGWPPC